MTLRVENDESRMLEEGMKKPPWRPLHLLGVATCFIGSHMFTHFPHSIQKYTAAYWIPYYVGVLLLVVPSLYVQLRLGATGQANVVALFSKYCPILKGVGLACVLRLMITSVYHGVLVAYSLYFMFASLPQPYSWGSCTEPWATAGCQNQTFVLDSSLAEHQYFENKVLQMSSGLTEEGSVPGHLAVSLLVCWAWVFTLCFPGMYYMGRSVTVLGGSALVMLVALMAYGREELRHGRPEGVAYRLDPAQFTEPDLKHAFLDIWLQGLLDGVVLSQVWEGIMPTIGKYAGPARLVSHLSWLGVAGVLVVMPHVVLNLLLPYLGGLAAAADLPVIDAMVPDVQLPFVVMPAAFHFLSIKRGVSFVFFFILFLLSSQTQVLYVSVAVDNIVDAIRTKVLRCCSRKWVLFTALSATYCTLGFCLGIPHVTQAGFYLLVLVRHWMNKLICFLIFFSFVAFTVSYAKQQHYPAANRTVFITWFVVASLLSTAIATYKAGFQDEPKDFTVNITISREYVYPGWAGVLGWFIAAGPLAAGLTVGFVHAVATAKADSCHKKLFAACFPDHRDRDEQPEIGSHPSYVDSQCADSALRY